MTQTPNPQTENWYLDIISINNIVMFLLASSFCVYIFYNDKTVVSGSIPYIIFKVFLKTVFHCISVP